MHASLCYVHRLFQTFTLFLVFGVSVAGVGQTKKMEQDMEAPTTVWSNNPLPCGKATDGGKPNENANSDRNVYLALGPDGLLYFTSSVCVFRLDASGTVTRIAGGGTPTKNGEVPAGKATKAYLPEPKGIAVDSRGNVFVSVGLRKIVEITRDGYLQVFYTANSDGVFSLTIDHQDSLYFLTSSGIVVRVSPDGEGKAVAGGSGGFGGDGGPALHGAFSNPKALTIDADLNIYIADTGNNRVRMVSADGTLTTVAGRDLGDDVISTVDGFPALYTRLPGPDSVAVDSSGNLLIGESSLARIRKVAWSGATVSSLFTYGGANYWGLFQKQVTTPPTFRSLAAARDGYLYAVDDAHKQIIKISPYGDMDVVIRTHVDQ